MELLYLIGGFVIGLLTVLVGYCITATTGIFTINETNPEKDYMKLHLDNQDHLFTKKYILLKIVRDSDKAQN